MTKAFRAWLPALMFVALLFTLRTVGREQTEWHARDICGARSIDEMAASAIRYFPVQHSAVVQDMLMLQWPAIVIASFIAPVPRPSYNKTDPLPLSTASYASLIVAIAGYWFLIGWWIDARFLGEPFRRHSMIARGILIVAAVCVVPVFFLLVLGTFVSAWSYHGLRGIYGATAWFALACLMLLTELGVFRRRA